MNEQNPNPLNENPTNPGKITFTCMHCHNTFTGYPNNPVPLYYTGYVCDKCNIEVIKARIQQILNK